ncbi:MAG: 4Fe-4S binding protein [Candidatus Thermoplasmatota archaeon]|nr:4Fe-4S binding protein [Candidatus Thermoplasmatota archaeon]
MASDIGIIMALYTLIITGVIVVIRFGGVAFRLPMQIGAFAFHRLGIFRKLPGAWHAPIPRTSGITCTLNCQACELAWLGCPIGMLQRYVIDTRLPIYVYGVLVAAGLALGRAICGWLCPFGLIMDLLNKVSIHKFNPPEWMRAIKYFYVIGAVVLAALTGMIFYCRYLCFGALLGVIPYWLTWHTVSATWLFFHLGVFAAYVAFGYLTNGRAWCRYFCPLGAILSLLNPISLIRRKFDWKWCTKCGRCKTVCPMGLDPTKDDLKSKIDCIKCGRCVTECKSKSLSIGTVFSGSKETHKKGAEILTD